MPEGVPAQPGVEAAIPHRGRLLLVDRLLEAGPDRARVAATVRPDWPLHGPGGVPPLVLVEALAQAAGLLMGHRNRDERMGGRGWLVGVKAARLSRAPVPAGTRLELEVEIVHEVDLYVVFRGVARAAGAFLAEAEIQTFQPAEMAAYGSEA